MLETFAHWRWYHVVELWVTLIALLGILLLTQSYFMKPFRVFLPYPNSLRGLTGLLRELGRASPVLLGELVTMLVIGLVMTAMWCALQLR